MKTTNYDEATVERLRNMYEELGNEGLEQIAETLGKSVRSIRSKLVREGIYVPSAKAATEKRDVGPSKKELLNELEAIVRFDCSGFSGATKSAISSLLETLRA